MRAVVTVLSRSLLALAVVVALPAAAAAHAQLDTADPGPDTVITELPDELVATFTQDLDPAGSSIELRDASGDVLATGDKDPAEDRTMRMPLPDLGPGTYEVRWTTDSAEDGEIERGTWTFTVEAPSPSPTPSPRQTAPPRPTTARPATPSPPARTPTPAPTEGDIGDPSNVSGAAVLLPILAAVAVAAGLGAWLVRSRRG